MNKKLDRELPRAAFVLSDPPATLVFLTDAELPYKATAFSESGYNSPMPGGGEGSLHT